MITENAHIQAGTQPHDGSSNGSNEKIDEKQIEWKIRLANNDTWS